MSSTSVAYTPGSLVKARGREWIVQPGGRDQLLRLRPISGGDEESALIHLGIEPDVQSAHFPLPEPAPEASQDAAVLLAEALRMSLRRGAGPFRCFGNIAVQPRTYQLVPLLMALKLDPIRLLIADDVGIGKTIEAGLIARELWDRGEVRRMTVLCPPHLVDQWERELEERFHLKAVAVTASSAARLERRLPINTSIFSVHPVTIVSLDYIKSDRRRDDFVRACPELVIVDEAHTCTSAGRGRQQRYQLLKALSEDANRHLVLLTATPHSGNETAFYNLLGLLKEEFQHLPELAGERHDALRMELAQHFVQRRRPDIAEWKDSDIFPRRETTELTYRLGGKWQSFFESVLDYCAEVTERAGEDERRRRLSFWGTLALIRCVSSSPAAAARALRTRLTAGDQPLAEEDPELREQLFDGTEADLKIDDVEPGANLGDPRVRQLMEEASALAGTKGDPKLALVGEHVEQLLADGFNPIIFCRYIATAHYVHEHLANRLKDVALEVVTGELPSEERERRVAALPDDQPRLMVATDCLSEGINLQEKFDAVVHYDLSWNPTRHEQREGRVDRFGQPRSPVRSTLLYGQNNPVDGAVLQVILRKAESIRKELGVPVPLPDDDHTLTEALMRAVVLRRGSFGAQGELFNYAETEEGEAIDVQWTDMAERAQKNRTRFAQRRLKPEDVLPEWERMQAALGSTEDVHRFVRRAMARLGAGLARRPKGGAVAPIRELPLAVRDRLEGEGLPDTLSVDFEQPPAPGCRFVHRSHPLVAALAEELMERSLASTAPDGLDLAVLGRMGVWRCKAVESLTTILLLRLRHQITTARPEGDDVLLVEEAFPVALAGRDASDFLVGEEPLAWLSATPEGDLPDPVRARELTALAERLPQITESLEALADAQAEALLADHRRVREAAEARGKYSVRALKPVDVVGAYVLLPVS